MLPPFKVVYNFTGGAWTGEYIRLRVGVYVCVRCSTTSVSTCVYVYIYIISLCMCCVLLPQRLRGPLKQLVISEGKQPVKKIIGKINYNILQIVHM